VNALLLIGGEVIANAHQKWFIPGPRWISESSNLSLQRRDRRFARTQRIAFGGEARANGPFAQILGADAVERPGG